MIPANVRDLLRGKAFLGAGAPRCELSIGDIGAHDWANPSPTRTPTANSAAIDIAERTDSHLIVVGIQNGYVYEGIIEDIDALIAADDCVTDWVSTGIEIGGAGIGGDCGVTRIGSELWLSVWRYPVDPTTAGDVWLKLYKSASGSGGDWAYQKTVLSDVSRGSLWVGDPACGTAGHLVVLPTGRWLLSGPEIYGTYFSYVRQRVWLSDDQGQSWAQTCILASGTYDGCPSFTHPGPRDIARAADGTLYASHVNAEGNLSVYLHRSLDDGSTWTTLGALGSGTDRLYVTSPALIPSLNGLDLIGNSNGSTPNHAIVVYQLKSEELTTETLPDRESDLQLSTVEWPDGATSVLNIGDYTVYISGAKVLAIPKLASGISVSSASVSIDPSAIAQRAVAEFPNVNPSDHADTGYYSPDRGDDDPSELNAWHKVLMPGVRAQLRMGYGDDMTEVFDGEADAVNLTANPGDYTVELDCRDYGAWLLDKTMGTAPTYTNGYTNKTVEYIVRDMLVKAGFADANISTEATGITVPSVSWIRETYANALEWAMSITGFELAISGESVSWHYPTDRQPAGSATVTLTGTTAATITGGEGQGHAPIVPDSVRVTQGEASYTTGFTVTPGSMDTEATIVRTADSDIPSGATVTVSYVYAAFVFREGETIYSLPYSIDRRDLYATVVVIGDNDGTEVQGSWTWSEAGTYGVPEAKVLFVDMPELTTAQQCQTAAAQLGANMTHKARQISFTAAGVPWLRAGDCIGIVESSSTASEIYRLLAIRHDWSNGELTTSGTAYHYGYAPLT